MTIDGALLLLVPLLVLPIVLLLRYVGCESFSAAEPEPTPTPVPPSLPAYKDLVLGRVSNGAQAQLLPHPSALVSAADLVGYWRLLDAVGSATARDEAGFQDGEYVTGQAIAPVPTGPDGDGSDAAPGAIVAPVPGLIGRDPTGAPRLFNGGYVRVAHKPGLHPREFTLLAWVQTTSAQNGNEHVVVCDGGTFLGPPTAGGQSAGLSLFVDGAGHLQATLRPVEVWKRIAVEGQAFTVVGTKTVRYGANNQYEKRSVTGNGQCTVAFFGRDPAQNVVKACDELLPTGGVGRFTTPVLMPVGSRQFIALTGRAAGGGSLVLTLYLNAKEVASATATDFLPADGAPLLIGVRNDAAGPAAAVVPTRPFNGQIQEVALYRAALFPDVIANLYAAGAAT